MYEKLYLNEHDIIFVPCNWCGLGCWWWNAKFLRGAFYHRACWTERELSNRRFNAKG